MTDLNASERPCNLDRLTHVNKLRVDDPGVVGGRKSLEPIAADVGGQYASSFRSKRNRTCLADAARGAGDHNRLVL